MFKSQQTSIPDREVSRDEQAQYRKEIVIEVEWEERKSA